MSVTVISSLRELPKIKMRVLIISAFLAVAAAAPSGLFQPIILPAVRTVAVPAAVPTISPGDIQAAAIDAEVQARDLAQAAADKARELAEQATENINEKIVTDSTVTEEKNIEALWSAEDKKWQALDALKTAEAQIDGAVASNADVLAKSVIRGVPYVAAVGPIAPIVAPIPPIVYTPYQVATKTLVQGQELKTEIKTEAAVKTAEPEKKAEAKKSESAGAKEAEKMESSEAAGKAAVNLDAKPALIGQAVFPAPIGLFRYDVIPGAGQVLTPTFVKTVW